MKPTRACLLPLCGLVLAWLLSSCASAPQRGSETVEAGSAQAVQWLQQGQYAEAAQAFLDMAAEQPGRSTHFRLRAAEAWSRGGLFAKVDALLESIDPQTLSSADGLRYKLLEGESAMHKGQAARALEWTSVSAPDMPRDYRVRLLRLRAKALALQQHPWQAARERARLADLLPADQQPRNRQRMLALLRGMGRPALQQQAEALADDDPLRPLVDEILSGRGMQDITAAPELNQPVGTLLPGAVRGEGYRLPGKVAVILPLSGPLQATGQAVLQGFFAAYFQAGSNVATQPPARAYDTHGTAEGALTAYQQAIGEGATMVVGPVTRAGVTAVFGQSGSDVPTLALNLPSSNVLPPLQAMEFTLSPEVEARQVARHMRAQGLATAIVIVSTESFAQRAAQAFKSQFEAAGGSVRTVLSLDRHQVDYRDAIATLDAGVPTKKVDDKVVVDTDALGWRADAGIFISMRPGQARLLLPQLHLARIQMPVFATSHVYDGRDNPVADGDLNGVEFCDVPWLFDAQPGLVSRARMAEQLPAARGASARLFAFGMDAWSLLPYLDWLREHPGSYLPGATGSLSEDGLGRVRRTLVWARFKDGLARPVAGSLEMGMPTRQPATSENAGDVRAGALQP